jgi:hypothetical protein
MPDHCFLIMQGHENPALAANLVAVLAGCAAQADVAHVPRDTAIRLPARAYLGVIVAAPSAEARAIIERLRAGAYSVPLFALVIPEALGEPPLELDACTVAVLQPGWPLELQRWLLRVTRRPGGLKAASAASAYGNAEGAIISGLSGRS